MSLGEPHAFQATLRLRRLTSLRPPNVPAGFDRAAFHREFSATVVQFFREQLESSDR